MIARHFSGSAEHAPFVASGFETDQLTLALQHAGYRRVAAPLFLWEGVTSYLTEVAVDRTIRWIAEAAPSSLLVFTYFDPELSVHQER